VSTDQVAKVVKGWVVASQHQSQYHLPHQSLLWVFRETALVHLSKSITMVDIFLCWKIDLLHIFNIVKDITHDFIRGMSKMIMQSFKV